MYIEAHRRYYAFDIVPGFWDALIDSAKQGIICSPLPVYEELIRSEDQLAGWARYHKETLFADPDEATVNAYTEIADLVVLHYEPQHVQVFLDGADPWVIASAKVHELAVVTMEGLKSEQTNPKSGRVRGKIQIPNVCRRVGVKHINTFDLLRALKCTFK
ncbi:MAG: DUF4411 family protein [Anaerolineae bacterium]|nr:DUF4411 family protein [Anaerolineae bacterium]